MNGFTAFQKLNDLDDDLLEEALILSPSGNVSRGRRQAPLWWKRFAGFCESGAGVALICGIVAFGVLAFIIAAGQNAPSSPPPAHGIPPEEQTTPPPDTYRPDYEFMSGFADIVEAGGVFEVFWHWTLPFFTIVAYIFASIGFLLQHLILKKCRRKVLRYSLCGTLYGICCIGIILCEFLMYIATGWDSLGVWFLYMPIIWILLGALLAVVVTLIRKCLRIMQSKH